MTFHEWLAEAGLTVHELDVDAQNVLWAAHDRGEDVSSVPLLRDGLGLLGVDWDARVKGPHWRFDGSVKR